MSKTGQTIYAGVKAVAPYVAAVDKVLHWIGGAPDPTLCDYLDAWVQMVQSGQTVAVGDLRAFGRKYLYRLVGYGENCPEYGIRTRCLQLNCIITIAGRDYKNVGDSRLYGAFIAQLAVITAEAGGPDYTDIVNDPSVPDETVRSPAAGLHLTVSGGLTVDDGDPGQMATTYLATDVATAMDQGLYALPISVGGGISPTLPAFMPDPVQPGEQPQKRGLSPLLLAALAFVAWRVLR